MEGTYFSRCADDMFWADRERVWCLIELYRARECLWNVKLSEYKNISKKKNAKVEIGTHFGLSGLCIVLLLIILAARANSI